MKEGQWDEMSVHNHSQVLEYTQLQSTQLNEEVAVDIAIGIW